MQRGGGASVNSCDDEVRCKLHGRVRHVSRREEACKRLARFALAAFSSELLTRVFASPQGWTPLMSASSTGNARVVNLLLGVGADVKAANSGGRTAAHYAASKGHAAILKLLLDSGARVSAKDSVGATPLHRAAAAGHVPAIRLLLAEGADIEACDKQGCTPILVAAQAGQDTACVTLAGAGADLSVKDSEGFTLPSRILAAAAASSEMELE